MATSDVEPIIIDGHPFRSVKEGKASILAPYKASDFQKVKIPAHKGASHNNDEGHQAVFYNPIQQYNRDLSVLATLVYGEGAVFDKQHKRHARGDKPKTSRRKKNQNSNESRSRDAIKTDSLGTGEPSFQMKRTAVEAELDDVTVHGAPSEKKPRDDKFENDDIEVKELYTAEKEAATNNTTGAAETTVTHQKASANNAQQAQIPFTILDALSASGLRAIRYAKEIPFTSLIVANDLSPDAVKSIDFNIDYNGLKAKVFSHVGDARQYMYSKTGNWKLESFSPALSLHRFDVIDLDPYGTAAPFFDAALQAIADGGLLCITCTDAGVFASNGYPEKCYALYGGIPMKGAHSHEAGLRLILHAIATSAAKYGLAIEPMLSLSIDFYARVFVRVHKSQQDVKLLAGTTMNVYNCDQGCGAWETQLLARNQERKDRLGATFYKHSLSQAPNAEPYCEHCGTKTHLAGPMWAGPIHNQYFVQKILDKLPNLDKTVYTTTERIKGMLTLALEEDSTNITTLVAPDATGRSATNATETANEAGVSIIDDITLTVTSPPSPSIPRLPPSSLDPTPFFHLPSGPSKVMHASTPSEPALRGALLRLGYRVTRSHCKPGSIKTNASWKVLWEIYREWLLQDGGDQKIDKLLGKGEFKGQGQLSHGTAGWRILRRLRGDKDTIEAFRVAEEVRRKLSWEGKATKSLEGTEDVREVLRSALYRLEHPAKSFEPSHKSNGIKETAIGITTAPSPERDAAETPETRDVSDLKVVFDVELGKQRRDKLVRYQMNPRANWGPMNRAGGT